MQERARDSTNNDDDNNNNNNDIIYTRSSSCLLHLLLLVDKDVYSSIIAEGFHSTTHDHTLLFHRTMATVANFPYTVNDEPTEDWTIEQVLQWWLLRAQSETEASYEDAVAQLSQTLESGKSTLWQDHEDVAARLQNENANPQQQQQTQTQTQTQMQMQTQTHTQTQTQEQKLQLSKASPVVQGKNASSASKNVVAAVEEVEERLASDTVRIDILQGEYAGSRFDLKPTARNLAWVGRSSGKKFRDKGISLAKDLEVSTTHGKFTVLQDQFIFMDEGSTNGSLIDGEKIDAKEAIPLQTGTEIMVGQTLMLVTLAE